MLPFCGQNAVLQVLVVRGAPLAGVTCGRNSVLQLGVRVCAVVLLFAGSGNGVLRCLRAGAACSLLPPTKETLPELHVRGAGRRAGCSQALLSRGRSLVFVRWFLSLRRAVRGQRRHSARE